MLLIYELKFRAVGHPGKTGRPDLRNVPLLMAIRYVLYY